MAATSFEETIVSAGHAAVVRVSTGTRFSVVDVEGGQVGDLFVFSDADRTESASASHTRSIIAKLFPRPGDTIYSNRRRPMLLLEEDISPGRHDTLYAACDPRRYEMLGVTEPHRSCAMNLAEAMEPYGGLLAPTPQPFNVFMEVEVDSNGELSVRPASSQRGDHLVFLALMDCFVVLSSCPMDIKEISTGGITPLSIRIHQP